MSYILKALRKSEQERQAIQAKSVTDRILLNQPRKSRKTVLLISAVILSNLILIAGFFWFTKLNSGPSTAVKVANPAAETEATEPVSEAPVKSGQPLSPIAQRPANAPHSIVEEIAARRRRSTRAQAGEPQNPASVAESEPSAPVDSNHDDIARQPDQTQMEATPDDGITPKAAPLQATKIPYLDELPFQVRQTIPKMTINAFVYSPDPAERFVVINMEKYKTGQRTKDSVELKEIRHDSLLAGYQDHTFLIERP